MWLAGRQSNALQHTRPGLYWRQVYLHWVWKDFYFCLLDASANYPTASAFFRVCFTLEKIKKDARVASKVGLLFNYKSAFYFFISTVQKFLCLLFECGKQNIHLKQKLRVLPVVGNY